MPRMLWTRSRLYIQWMYYKMYDTLKIGFEDFLKSAQ